MNEQVSVSVEDAFSWLVRALRRDRDIESLYASDHGLSMYGYGIYLPNIIYAYAMAQLRATTGESLPALYQRARQLERGLSPAFMSAAWDLCRRGVIRPGVMGLGLQSTPEGAAGAGYSLTPYGEKWIRESPDAHKYDFIPTEVGRHGERIQQWAARFGEGFKQRANDAIKCYQAQAFFAACAMCGAAAESILLAIAVAKAGDASGVLEQYLSSGGRRRILDLVVQGLDAQWRRQMDHFMFLLSYWRDASSHGAATNITEEESFTSWALLIQFAHVSFDNWVLLTVGNSEG